MKVVFFQRKQFGDNYSIEGMFNVVREYMPPEVECIFAQSKYESRGCFKRLYNIIEAVFRQGDVNHIEGDVHFISYLLKKRKTLLTIADCVFAQYTSGIRKHTLRLFWYFLPEKRVAIISVISQATKNELMKYVICNPNKIRVVPACISPCFIYNEKTFNATRPRILQVGTGQNKNLYRLFEAIRDIPCQLELVGALTTEHKEMLERNKINYSNSCSLSLAEMVGKYQECDLVTFVSTYEGFGMPILEANAVGRPVITSNIFSMPEVAGNAACLINPFNVSEIRDGIMRIIKDEEYRNTLVKNGLANTLRFSPATIAGQYFEIYKELLIGC